QRKDLGVVCADGGGEPSGPRRITPVGHRLAGEPLGQVVMRETDGGDAGGRLRLVLAQPCPFRRGDAGDRNGADALRPCDRAEPRASTVPSSASTTSTFVDWVELSTPAASRLFTVGMLLEGAPPRFRAVEFFNGRERRATAGRKITAHGFRVTKHAQDVPAC